MLIRRCAWHRTYHRYPMAIGIASWRGLRVSFTDGMCAGCAVRFRRQWNLPPITTDVAPLAPAIGLIRGAATLVMVMSLILAARPLDDVFTPATMTAPPETVLVPSAPGDEESMPSLAVRYAPRRTRAAAARTARIPSPAVSYAVSPPPAGSHVPTSIGDATTRQPIAFDTAIELVTAPATIPRFPAATALAALPHAGLTQQTP